tara:strand:+ start:193 stop:588 length:396 start_codon:yes stop_codon:yes gene_type:complete
MGKIWIVIGSIVVIAGLLIWTAVSNAAQNSEARTFQTVQSDMETKGALLIDVRTEGEYTAGHITGAQLLPLQTLQTGVTPEVASDTAIYVYCRSGNRSAQATELLKEAGFTNVVDLGAISSVQAIGGEIVQ